VTCDSQIAIAHIIRKQDDDIRLLLRKAWRRDKSKKEHHKN